MKQSLQLRLGQTLTMTPQLQQAIRMLQLSTLELQTEIQQALETNVMLEESTDLDLDVDDGPFAEAPPEVPQTGEAGEAEGAPEPAAIEERDLSESMSQPDNLPDELPVDSLWEDTFDSPGSGSAASDDDRPLEYGDTSSESLREHLLWQMRMTPLTPTDEQIAESIIDAVGDDGFLSVPLADLHAGLRDQGLDVDLEEVETVLHIVQNFDPPGIAARDLRETLLLQLRQLDADTPHRDIALRLIERHFDLLAARDYAQLKRRLRIEEEELLDAVRLVQSLRPRPGAHIGDRKTEYIVPDVRVRKLKGRWLVELNPEAAPRLRVNAHYASLIKQIGNDSDATTLKNHLQEARWFIKSLLSRNETLLKVATAIVEHQREFLERGEVAMKAMVLHDIAEELGMHESTISRVTTRKYMHTPRGIFELKYFFSSHVGTVDGGECSSTAIRALIKKMIAEENAARPLSDSKLTDMLADRGINVARRTVAKYREAMAIPPSNERKRLA